MAEAVVEILEVVDVVISSDSGSFLARASSMACSMVVSKNLRLGELREGSVRALGAYDLEIFWRLVDFLLGGVEPLFPASGWRLFHSLAVCTRLSTMVPQALRSLELPSFSLIVGEALVVVAAEPAAASIIAMTCSDLAHHLRADYVDALG